MIMKKIKEVIEEILDNTIDKLIELQLNISDDPAKLIHDIPISVIQESEESVRENWSIWMIATSTHFAIVASQDGIDEVIPEDGSFISGILIQSGLSEEMAKKRIDDIGVTVSYPIQEIRKPKVYS